MTASANPSRRDAASLWKLLSSNDRALVDRGIEIAESIGEPMQALLEGVSVNERTGELIRNIRFTGTKSSQPNLDRVLLHQLSLAAADSAWAHVREQVKKITVSLHVLPVLKGFEGLHTLEVSLTEPQSTQDVEAFEDLKDFGSLPSLTHLTIKAESLGGDSRKLLRSLSGLYAPLLEEVRLNDMGLSDIGALSDCNRLRLVDLSRCPQLTSIAALAPSVNTLRVVNLAKCEALDSIAALKGAHQLHWLNLDDCSAVNSLKPLSESRQLSHVSFSGLSALTSLEGLACPVIASDIVRLGHTALVIAGCSSLASLDGLPPLDPSITSVVLHELDALTELSGLQPSPTLQDLSVKGKALIDLHGLELMSRLSSLNVSGSAALADIQPLGEIEGLAYLEIEDCSHLTALPLAWNGSLVNLNMRDCDALNSLGRLPKSLKRLRIAGCKSLRTLDGLEGLEELDLSIVSRLNDEVSQAAYIEDASSLAHIPKLMVNFAPAHAPDKQVDVRTTVFPAGLARALAHVPALMLTVDDRRSSWYSSSLMDCAALALIPSLRCLDLSRCRDLADLQWLVTLPALESLMLHSRSEAAKLAKASTHGPAERIRKLQASLCKKYGLALPAHLQPVSAPTKPAAKTRLVGKSSKEIAALKKLLKSDVSALTQAFETLRSLDDASMMEAVFPDLVKALAKLLGSSDPALVMQGVELLRDCAPSAAFDELTEGMNLKTAYSADSEAIGKIFRNVKQPDRALARWALTWLLALAPPSALRAIERRQSVQEIDLTIPSSLGEAPVPSLTGFTALTVVTIRGCNATDLSLLTGLEHIKTLRLAQCQALTSLQGLNSAKGLERFAVTKCPVLLDLSILGGMSSLSTSPDEYPGQEALRIDIGAGLNELGFVKGLRAARKIRLHIASSARTEPFTEAPWIQDVDLKVGTWSTDLSGLLHCASLTAESVDEHGEHNWTYDFPALKRLRVLKGRHRFAALRAPALEHMELVNVSVDDLEGLGSCRDFRFYDSKVRTLSGIGGAATLWLWQCKVDSFVGIETSQIKCLNLANGTYSGIGPLQRLATLESLTLNPDTSKACVDELANFSQVRTLVIRGYSGSLGFLAGWNSLQELDLRESGPLSDLDALTTLTSVRTIYIRGGAVKKDAWPAQLKASLDTR